MVFELASLIAVIEATFTSTWVHDDVMRQVDDKRAATIETVGQFRISHLIPFDAINRFFEHYIIYA